MEIFNGYFPQQYIGSFSASASGAQYVTGTGFKPNRAIVLCWDTTGTNKNISIGLDIVSSRAGMCLYLNGTSSGSNGSNSIYVSRDGSNSMLGQITSFDSGGCTITFTLTGTCPVSGLVLLMN